MSTIDLNLNQFTRSRLVNGVNDNSLVNIIYTYTIPLPRDGSNNIIRDESRNANASYRLVGSFTEDTRANTPSNNTLNFTNQIRIFTETLPQLSGSKQNFNVTIDLNNRTFESPLYIYTTTSTGGTGKFRNITMIGTGTLNNGIYFYVGAEALNNNNDSTLKLGKNDSALILTCKMNCLSAGSTQPTGLMGICTIEGYGNLIMENDNTVLNITSFPKISNFAVGGEVNVTKINDPKINYIVDDTYVLLKYREDSEEEETTVNKQIAIDIDYTGSMFKNFTDSEVTTLNEMTTINIYGPYHSDTNTGVDTTNGTAIIITYINEPTVKLAIKSSGYEGEWISQNEAGVVIAESKIDGYLNVDVESNAILQFQGCIFNNDLSSDRTPLSFTGTGTVNFAGGYPNIDNNVENACYPLYNMINAVSEYEVIVNNDANIIFDNNNNTNNFYVNLPAGFVRNEDDTLDTPIFQLTNINFSDKSLVTSATYNFGSTPSGSTQIDVVFPYHPEEESLTATLINTSINSGMNVRFANNYYVSLYNDETQLTENIEGEGNTSEYNIQFQNLTLNVDNSDKILGLNGDGGYTFLSGFINCTLPDVTPIVVNGTCSVLFADGEVTTDGATNQPKYIMQSNTTGNSLITLGNNSLSCSGGVHIYWPTLENVTTSKPLNSKTRQYYAADYEPNVITTVTHGSDGAYSHSQIICRCTPGFEDLGWDDNVGSLLYSESISIGSNTYDSENIFNSNVFDTSYYGSLDGNSTYTRNFLLSSAVVVTTISFANTSSSYLGNASMKLNPTTGTAFVNAFGEGPIFQYDIVENSTLPTLTFVDDILQIINFGQTRKTVRMELSKSLGVELYVYPYLGENTDRLDIAKIFQYKNIDASYVSYDDYIDDANVSKLIKLSIGTESFNFLVNYDYESNRSYAIGKSLYFDLSPLTPTNAGNPTVAFETADGITVENYGPLNYPVISLSSDYDFINNGNIEDGVDNEVDNSGNLNESTENDPLVVTTDDVGQYADSAFSYTKRYYIGMFIKTIGNADHVLTITGTSDGYTYEFASVDSSPVVDNGGNTATMTFDGDDYTLYPVDITITTNGDANLYNIGARENFKIEVSDSAALVGLNDAETIASVPTYLRSEFYFPIVVETRFDSLSWENSGTPTKEIGVNTSVLLSARIVGTANTNMDLVFNMASNNSGFWLYDGSNECKEQLVLTLNSGSGAQTETSKTIHRYDNKYIIGAGSTDDTPTITLTPYTVNNLDFLQSVTALQLNHIASEQLNHIITYDVSLGNSEDLDDGTSSNRENNQYVAQPLEFTDPDVIYKYAFSTTYNQDNYGYFGGRIDIYFNSVPYNLDDGTDYPIDIHYVVSVSDNGSDWTELPESDYVVRDNESDIVGNSIVEINRDTYDSQNSVNVRYITTDERYNYVKILYYATRHGSELRIDDGCDYYHLPEDVEEAVEVARFDYSNSYSVKIDDSSYNSEGTVYIDRAKGNSVTIYVRTSGPCLENTNIVLDISTTTAAFTIGNTESTITVPVEAGNRVGSSIFTILNNREYIAGGDQYLVLTPSYIGNGVNTSTNFITIDEVQINDTTNSYLRFIFDSTVGLGESGSTTYVTANNYNKVPSGFTASTITPLEATSADVGGCVNVRLNNIPYLLNQTNENNDAELLQDYPFGFNVVYRAYGAYTSNGQYTQLTYGQDYTANTYNSNLQAFNVLDSPQVEINPNTYDGTNDQNKIYFILSKSVNYKLLKIGYYISDNSNQYTYAASSSSPETIAIFDYSNAPTGIVESRIFNIGDWQLRSDPAGCLLFEYIGTLPSDGFVNRIYKLTPAFLEDDNTVRIVDSTLTAPP